MRKPSKSVPVRLRARWRKLWRPQVISVDGLKIRAAPASVVSNLYKENHEWEERVLIQHGIRKSDRVLEIGAGIGVVSLLCAKICGLESLLIYEANPAMEDIIKNNFALNGMTPNLRMRAISTSSGEIDMHLDENVLSSSAYPRRRKMRREKVKTDAISDVIQEFAPTCIVMDVEGMEVDLLPAAPLQNVRAIIVEMHPHVVGENRIVELEENMRDKGFVPISVVGDVHMYARREKGVLMEQNAS